MIMAKGILYPILIFFALLSVDRTRLEITEEGIHKELCYTMKDKMYHWYDTTPHDTEDVRWSLPYSTLAQVSQNRNEVNTLV